jgi:hypothetical protein
MKDSPASMVMTTGMSMLASTTSGPAMLGSTCDSTIRVAEVPSRRSASMKGALRRVSIWARATRPKCGTSVTATIAVTSAVDGPNTATTASARTRLGKEEMMSKTIRITRSQRVLSVRRQDAEQRPQHQGGGDRDQGDQHRHLRPEDEAAVEVASEMVGAQPMGGGGTGEAVEDVERVRVMRHDQRREDGGADDHDDDDGADRAAQRRDDAAEGAPDGDEAGHREPCRRMRGSIAA